jgi:hypothetical protein
MAAPVVGRLSVRDSIACVQMPVSVRVSAVSSSIRELVVHIRKLDNQVDSRDLAEGRLPVASVIRLPSSISRAAAASSLVTR